AWTWVDSILEAWKHSNEPPEPYQAGTWGPVASIGLLARANRSWYESKITRKKK
ncbi:glucose-6-phosphate dehydrogenase, partial [Alteromonas sp. 14N.309.X.WAT.G.H12]